MHQNKTKKFRVIGYPLKEEFIETQSTKVLVREKEFDPLRERKGTAFLVTLSDGDLTNSSTVFRMKASGFIAMVSKRPLNICPNGGRGKQVLNLECDTTREGVHVMGVSLKYRVFRKNDVQAVKTSLTSIAQNMGFYV